MMLDAHFGLAILPYWHLKYIFTGNNLQIRLISILRGCFEGYWILLFRMSQDTFRIYLDDAPHSRLTPFSNHSFVEPLAMDIPVRGTYPRRWTCANVKKSGMGEGEVDGGFWPARKG